MERDHFSGAMEFCPVCMLRMALAGGVESGESSSEDTHKPKRFEHYELVTGEDEKPLELGRGAMGVTYKAFDINLHCPVTLKVVSERYLGDESARLRFLREARATASVRHPNVARCSIWVEPARVISTQWSLSKGKRLKSSSNGQADSR